VELLCSNCRFIEPLILGDYPRSMRSRVGSRLPEFSKSEAARLKGSLDFVGINYYTTFYARNNSTDVIGVLLNDSIADTGAITLRKLIVILLFIDPLLNFYDLQNIVPIITKLEIYFNSLVFLYSAFLLCSPAFSFQRWKSYWRQGNGIEANIMQSIYCNVHGYIFLPMMNCRQILYGCT
jgi:hypothetical protein